MTWPSPQDYAEAVQSPQVSFADVELQKGHVRLNALGLPKCFSGAFATVFCMEFASEKRVAVRCFLHDIKDQQERYAQISKFVLVDTLPYTVGFEYQKNGILIRGDWYPILKMEWVEGQTLGTYLEGIKEPELFGILAGYFKQMTLELNRAGIAHGDLQHDNIMISETELRLVDYDGMFVPSLKGHKACELGHRNYQHPARNSDFFDASLDNFGAWVIYSSLRCLALDPSLWTQLSCGSDCMLFRSADFASVENSQAFKILDAHKNEKIRRFAEVMRHLLTLKPVEVPTLEVPLYESVSLRERKAKSEPPARDPKTQIVLKVVPSEGDNLPAVWVPDEYYPLISMLDTNRNPANGTEINFIDVVSPQLLPGESIKWASRTSPVRFTGASSDFQTFIAPPLLALLVPLTVILPVLFPTAFILPFTLVLAIASFAVGYSLFRVNSSTVHLVTDKRIVVATLGRSVSLYSIPFEDLGSVSIQGDIATLNAAYAFRTPEGTLESLNIRCRDTDGLVQALPTRVKVTKLP